MPFKIPRTALCHDDMRPPICEPHQLPLGATTPAFNIRAVNRPEEMERVYQTDHPISMDKGPAGPRSAAAEDASSPIADSTHDLQDGENYIENIS